jgi:hypothetical protein
MDDYIILEEKFANKSRIWNKHSHSNSFILQEESALCNNKEILQFSFDINEERYKYSHDEIQSILLNPQSLSFEMAEIYFDMYLKTTRFDSNIVNISLDMKVKFATIFADYIFK